MGRQATGRREYRSVERGSLQTVATTTTKIQMRLIRRSLPCFGKPPKVNCQRLHPLEESSGVVVHGQPEKVQIRVTKSGVTTPPTSRVACT
jgi:hypothetical protein